MAQKPKSTSRARHSKGGKKPVTIDLEAGDVKSSKTSGKDAAAKKPAPAASKSSPTRKSVPAAGKSETATTKTEAAKEATDTAKTQAAKPASTTGKPPEKSGTKTGFGRTGTPNAAEKASAAPGTASRPAPATSAAPAATGKKEKKSGFGSTLLAACIGGVIALGLAGLLQYAGILGTPGASSGNGEIATQLESRIAGLEGKLAEQPAAGPSGDEIAALVDERIASQPGASAERITAAETAIKQMREQLGALPAGTSLDAATVARINELAEDVAALKSAPATAGDSGSAGLSAEQAGEISASLEESKSQISALGERLSKTGDQIGSLRQQIGGFDADLGEIRQQTTAAKDDIAALRDRVENGADKRAATAIAAAALKSDIDSGKPFAASLANLKAFAPGDTDLQSLEVFAESGVPTVAELTAQFQNGVSAAIIEAASPKEEGGIAARLAAGARALVEVKPIGEIEGDSPAARVSQILAGLKNNDLSKASSIWEQLPEAGREASKDWHDRLQARLTANTVIGGTLEDILNSSRGG